MDNKTKRKIINIKSITAVSLSLLLVLIFLSRTIYNYNLPVVTAVSPQNGTLNKIELTTGIVKYEDVSELYLETGGKIDAILVREGEAVSKGQPIMEMSFEDAKDDINKQINDTNKQIKACNDDIQKKLGDLNISRDKLQVDIEKINTNISNTKRKIDELKQEVYKQDNLSDFELIQCQNEIAKAEEDYERLKDVYDNRDSDYELTQLYNEITKLEGEYKKLKILYESGGITKLELNNCEYSLQNLYDKYENLKKTKAENDEKSKQELDTSRYNIQSLYRKYENLKKVLSENIEKSNDNITDKETNRQKQLKDYEYQLETYNQDLITKTLDLNANALQETAYKKDLETKISDYNESLADYNESLADYEKSAVVCAPEDSFVITIAVNQGQQVNANQLLASFGITGGYQVDCEVSLNNNFVVAGDKCVLNNSSHSLDGIVTKVTPDERSKKITISIQSGRTDEQFTERTASPDEVTSGETFEITFEKVSSESYTLVPNGAVNKDSDGYFLNQIKRRNGILGKEFYTQKLRVYIGDSDSENTVIVKGIGFFEPIVLLSDKPYSDGDTIKIKNESDFFEE